MVGDVRFELTASRAQDERSSQAELNPDGGPPGNRILSFAFSERRAHQLRQRAKLKNGAGDGTRTHDIDLGKIAF